MRAPPETDGSAGRPVETVTGAVAGEELGVTLMHEHTVFGFAGAEHDYRLDRPPPEAVVERLAPHLEHAYAAGVRTIVDAACADLGRDVCIDVALAERTGVNIICSTGLYSILPLPQFANPFRPASADDLAGNFVRELEEGIGDTGVRAGVIKVATPFAEMTDYAETVLRAAAMAQVQTGAPIITHTEGGTLGVEQAELFAAEGADLGRVVIGHNDTADLAYLQQIAELGAVLGFDRFGHEEIFPERLRFESLLALIRMGFEQQIVLSHDCNLGRVLPRGVAPPARAIPASYAHLLETVVPRLREAGVADTTVETMLIDNPRRILSSAASAFSKSNPRGDAS